MQQRAGKELMPIRTKLSYAGSPSCTEGGCERFAARRGLCSAHYQQLLKNGKTEPIYRDREQCGHPDCSKANYAKGMCAGHYNSIATHGLTIDRYVNLRQSQGGACAICRVVPSMFHIDHDHECCPGSTSCGMCVRGLLCPGCNQGLAMFRDSDRSLIRAARYITESRLNG
ncbi:endonuclease domain-containing protein [Streptomyces sp. NPDC127112]|uniref:endonuclease domain-containing protein n=1 Tax=Streptomyces sp. NPDC127112 TaxID=3345364 RepID=UPI00362C0790